MGQSTLHSVYYSWSQQLDYTHNISGFKLLSSHDCSFKLRDHLTYGASIGNRQEIRVGIIMKAAKILGLIHVHQRH